MIYSAESLVVIDIETSGVNPFNHQALSVSLFPFDESIEPLNVYVNHDHIDWNPTAKKFFENYKSHWEAEKVAPESAFDRVSAYLAFNFDKPITLVGHNVGFDIGFLKQLAYCAGKDEFTGISHRTIDTHTALYLLQVMGLIDKNVKNSSDAFDYFGIRIASEERHTSAADAQATKELFLKILSLLTTEKIRGVMVGH